MCSVLASQQTFCGEEKTEEEEPGASFRRLRPASNRSSGCDGKKQNVGRGVKASCPWLLKPRRHGAMDAKTRQEEPLQSISGEWWSNWGRRSPAECGRGACTPGRRRDSKGC